MKTIEINQELILLQEKFNKLPILKTSGMVEEYEKKRRKQVSLMRSLLDYGIGFMIALAGAFLFFRSMLNLSFNETYPPNWADKAFGALCFFYGCWRMYRGYKKNYFK